MRQRPISVIIFGILNIGFALFGFVGVLITAAMEHMASSANPVLQAMKSSSDYALWKSINSGFALLGGTALLAAGIGLLLLQNWARIVSIIWAVLDIIFTVVGTFFALHYLQPAGFQAKVPPSFTGLMHAITVIFIVLGMTVVLAYPILLLIFMTRPKILSAFQPPLPPLPPPVPN